MLVSVVVPVYNRRDLIDETIASALSQDWPSLEVVAVDNASTDGTWESLQSWASRDPRLRIHRNATNIGATGNWQRCLDLAAGTLTKILWSDDLMSPDFLTRTVPRLQDPDVGFVYTAARLFSTDAEAHVLYRAIREPVYGAERFIERSLLTLDLPVSPGCAVFRTDDLRRHLATRVVHPVAGDLHRHAIGPDLLLFLRTAADYKKVAYVDEPLAHFRSHAGSISTSTSGARLLLYYDVAKAAFVSEARIPASLERRFNARLLLDHLRLGGRSLGFAGLSDYYPAGDDVRRRVDAPYLLRLLLAAARRRVGKR